MYTLLHKGLFSFLFWDHFTFRQTCKSVAQIFLLLISHITKYIYQKYEIHIDTRKLTVGFTQAPPVFH